MHLTNEQFEDVLQNNAVHDVTRHMAGCAPCRRRLEEARAIQERLRKAFGAVHASPALAERIRSQAQEYDKPGFAALRENGDIQVFATAAKTRKPLFSVRRLWPVLAAAAAIVGLALPIAIYFSGPSAVQAAPRELVAIHEHNLGGNHGFFVEDDPAKLASYFKQRLGFIPAMPKINQGLSIRGCCVRKFLGRIVGSYVVNTPHGPVSVIVVNAPPENLGMSGHSQVGEQTIWTGGFSGNRLAAVRMGEFTYCAVGQGPAENLTQLLVHLFE